MDIFKLPVNKDHNLVVKDFRVFCTICNKHHIVGHSKDGLLASLLTHDKLAYKEGHKPLERIPFKHVLYIAYLCECGKIVIDEEQ